MNSELTREQISVIKSIADNKGGDLDTIILTAWEVQSLAVLALVGLSVQQEKPAHPLHSPFRTPNTKGQVT